MASPRQQHIRIFAISLSAARTERSLQEAQPQGWLGSLIALAIMFVLTVAANPAQAQTFTVLHNFSGGGDGANPDAGVTLDGAGNLYGTTSSGGTGYGAVYKLTHIGSSWPLDPLYEFHYSDGASPKARVIFGPNGTLYGTTADGGTYEGGTVFNLRPFPTVCRTALCPWMETVLHSFSGYGDGANPLYGDLSFDHAGDIYGTTYQGVSPSAGTVFELMPSGDGWIASLLYAFLGGSDGAFPENGVIFDNAGNLYVTTHTGGVGDYGTVFELMYPGGRPCTIYHFSSGQDGGNPIAGLVFDHSGNLFGATSDFGSGGGGTVFELTQSSNCTWTLQTLYSFTGAVGCGPWASLVMDGAGNLYGTTNCNGANEAGNVFKLTYPNWTYTSLHDFTGGSDGGKPVGGVALDASGNLYGTTYAGGAQDYGVVWEITP